MINDKIAGIICEYNPFHNGHAYQIKEIRNRGYGIVVAVMSGNTVQRGEFAITDKYTRARAALLGGVDLVLELPYPYSSSSTEFFATAGIRLLSAIGADAFCFGSESGDLEKLAKAAKICLSSEFESRYKELCISSFGTASAYFEAYRQISGEEMPSGSNDILGVAYLKAIISDNLTINPEVVVRRGSNYRDVELANKDGSNLPSALMIRNEIQKNGVTDKLTSLMPDTSYRALADAELSQEESMLERSILSFFRLSSPLLLSSLKISEAGGGLAEKLCKMSHKAHSLQEMKDMVMDGKYTASRIRRTILHCMTGAAETDVRQPPAYTTVLGFNPKGKALLGHLRRASLIPIITKPSDAARISEGAARQNELSLKADALFSLCFEEIHESSKYLTASPVIIK